MYSRGRSPREYIKLHYSRNHDRLSKLTAKAPGLIQPISGSCRYTSLHELRKPYYWEGICANVFVIAAAAESWKDAARI